MSAGCARAMDRLHIARFAHIPASGYRTPHSKPARPTHRLERLREGAQRMSAEIVALATKLIGYETCEPAVVSEAAEFVGSGLGRAASRSRGRRFVGCRC